MDVCQTIDVWLLNTKIHFPQNRIFDQIHLN